MGSFQDFSPHCTTIKLPCPLQSMQPLSLACRSYRNMQSKGTLSKTFGSSCDAGMGETCVQSWFWVRTGCLLAGNLGKNWGRQRCFFVERAESIGALRLCAFAKGVPLAVGVMSLSWTVVRLGSSATAGGHHAIACLLVVRPTCFFYVIQTLQNTSALEARAVYVQM
jgi:hypothetical protein